MPPLYSALKINGKRSSDLVRSGKEVELKARDIQIFQLELLEFDLPYFTIKSTVSGGCYVRSLVRDIGIRLKTHAHVVDLQRTRQAQYDLSQSITYFPQITKQQLLKHIQPLQLQSNQNKSNLTNEFIGMQQGSKQVS